MKTRLNNLIYNKSRIKYVVLTALWLISPKINGQENYILTIDNEAVSISLDEVKTIQYDNKPVTLSLKLKDTLTYIDSSYEFNYSKEYSVAKTEIDAGIEQVMLMSAEGDGIIVQSYTTMNPKMLRELLLSEITKESISYGYELKREDYNRTLINGVTIEVLKAVLEYKDTKSIYEVATLGDKDEGVLIMTMIQDVNFGTNKQIVDLLWDSFKYK